MTVSERLFKGCALLFATDVFEKYEHTVCKKYEDYFLRSHIYYLSKSSIKSSTCWVSILFI